MDPTAVQRTQKQWKKFKVLLKLQQTGKQFREQQTGTRRAEAKLLVRDRRLAPFPRRQRKQEPGTDGSLPGTQAGEAGKCDMTKNNVSEE